ncbi:hypothetical protein [Aeoliella mucimassa]|uniref:Uncharacterized protein n=1 Tax=Aeoliella mucimassa TaxID=2527972 RepID=A0A518AM34_9BACT|nr:hypothetical protein [Aeoliella mucimassa]QDU55782.1 hypothetical protein Pan181_19780 [Aeoliella mucimassa]
MAAKTETPTATLPNPEYKFAPTDVDAHTADLQRRAAEREKKQQVLEDCLDPEVAARHELKKQRFRWRVAGTLRRAVGSGRFSAEEKVTVVVAENEDQAWAQSCDVWGVWPSRKHGMRDLTITKIGEAETGEKTKMPRKLTYS